MGYALMWAETLAAALIALALATAWSARGRRIRFLWPIAVYVVVAVAAVLIVALATMAELEVWDVVQTRWLGFLSSWAIAFAILGLILLRRGLCRSSVEQVRAAATWSRWMLWLGLGGAILAVALTFWNLDLTARADLAIGRQEAGAILLAMYPPPVPDSENAARVYERAAADLDDKIENAWFDAARSGMDAQPKVDWKSREFADLVKKHASDLALLRKAGAMPHCFIDDPPKLLEAVGNPQPWVNRIARNGTIMLAIDARVEALNGNLPRAFEDIDSILGIVRHLSGRYGLYSRIESTAWRTLEDVLHMAPSGNEALPALDFENLPPIIRKTREERVLYGMIMPTIASQPSAIMEQERKKNDALAIFGIEFVFIPLARVVFAADDLETMHRLIDEYRISPQRARDETPNDWALLREQNRTDRMSAFSAYFIKPKLQQFLREAEQLAALRKTSQTGLAIEAYRRKHGKFPERLEQLVPEFFSSVPVDSRDGQPLRIKRIDDTIVVYAPADADAVEHARDLSELRFRAVFRLAQR